MQIWSQMTGTLKVKLLLLPLLLVCLLAHSQQSTYSYPDFFYATYPFMINYDNPAYIVEDTRYNLYSQYKQRLGQFRKIVSYSVQAEKVWRREQKNTNSLRVIFNNENEGPYITRPRFYAGYANEISVNENVKIGLGFTLGATAINFSAPNQGASGNSYLPDGKLGFVLKGKKLESGVSSLQVFNAKSRVVGANIALKRYYNFFLKYKTDLSLNWVIEGLVLADLRGSKIIPLAAVMAHYDQRFSIGFSNRFGYAFSVFGKIKMFQDQIPLDLIFMYNSPIFSNTTKELNSVEIALSLGIK